MSDSGTQPFVERRTVHREPKGSDPVTRYEFELLLTRHSEQERKVFQDELAKAIGPIMDAFPDGPANHRMAHEKQMKAAEAEENFWRELKVGIAKKSIWGILQVLIFLLVAGLAAKFGLNALPFLTGK